DGTLTSTATVTLTVTGANDKPVAVNDAATVNEDSGANTIDVRANDTDPDNLAAPFNAGLTVSAVTQGAHGTVAINTGNLTVSYTPAANYFGSDSFTYTITDGTLTSTATVNVTVTGANDGPVAVNDTATVTEDSGANTIDVRANDTDPDNLAAPFNAGLTVSAR